MHNATFSELRRGLGVTAGTSIREEMHFAREKGQVSTVVHQDRPCYAAFYRRFLQCTRGNVHGIGVFYRHERKILTGFRQ